MQIKSLPAGERPMEKAERFGIKRLSNSELLALIIHTGTRDNSALRLAEEILSKCDGGLSNMGSMNMETLTDINGIGSQKACTILASVELGKRISTCFVPGRKMLDSCDEVARLFMEDLRYEKKEHFKSVMVNVRSEMISIDDISVGELTGAIVHPREAFRNAVRQSAAGIIFVHNHPSGDPTPSEEDIAITKRLAESGQILGIRVLDHVIIGNGTFKSMRAMELIE